MNITSEDVGRYVAIAIMYAMCLGSAYIVGACVAKDFDMETWSEVSRLAMIGAFAAFTHHVFCEE